MARMEMGSVAQQIETLFNGGSMAALTDGQLLERFNARRDAAGEAAFAALVTRHGPMVLGVCHQLLDDRHLAEDAFQATFLILARRARSIYKSDWLGNWLYGVASRTARCARLRLARRRKREEVATMARAGPGVSVEPTVPAAEEAVILRDQARVLHGEIERLPDAFRLPVVLCYLEGLTVHEAARRLQCSHGTVRSRMARAREKLRRGLARRGVVMPAAALALVLESSSLSASVAPALCGVTTQAALRFMADSAAVEILSSSTMILAQEVMRSMLIERLKLIAVAVLILGAAASGVGYLNQSLATNDEPVKPPVAKQSGGAGDSPGPVPGPGRMFVTGVVLDSTGKPAARATVDIIGRPRSPWVVTREHRDPRVLIGHGDSDASGHFHIDAARTTADGFFEVYAVAGAPGHGIGWVRLNADARLPAAQIRLRPEQVIQGKLLDVQGQPASGVELNVWSVGRPNVPEAIGGYDGVSMGNSPVPDGVRVWPRPVTTDANGRFTVTGIGRNVNVGFHVRDDRFASEGFRVNTDDHDGPKTITEVVRPAMLIEGRVLADDTGQPIPHALVEVGLTMGGGSRFRADDLGRFKAHVQPAKSYRVQAFPPEGQPYLIAQAELAWTKGVVRKEIDVKVPRGIVIRGQVIDATSNRALPEASVQYIPTGNQNARASGWQTIVASDKDGRYQITVPAGRGHLFVFGPTSDYILKAIGSRALSGDQPGGVRKYAHEIIPYEVKAGEQPHELIAKLRPGKTVTGRVLGPDDQTVEDAMIVTTLHIEHFHLIWRGDLTLHARDGLFELHGLDPEKPARVSFLDSRHEWGATVELTAKQAGEDILVRLLPCGQAKVRFVGPGGKPVANVSPSLEILGTPGPHEWDRRKESQSTLAADAAPLANVDRNHYSKRIVSDAEGRVTLPALIPGASYRISDFSTVNDPAKGVQARKDFTIKPGEVVDLGEILIENPQWYGQ